MHDLIKNRIKYCYSRTCPRFALAQYVPDLEVPADQSREFEQMRVSHLLPMKLVSMPGVSWTVVLTLRVQASTVNLSITQGNTAKLTASTMTYPRSKTCQ
jgi:hypothetical protein